MHDHDHHPTDEDLLRAIDHELPSERLISVEVHLAQCDPCRRRSARLDSAAAEIAGFYAEHLAAPDELIGRARAELRSRLNAMAEGWDSGVRARLVPVLVWLPRALAIGAALAAAALIWIRVGTPSPIEPDALPIASLTPGASWNVGLREICAGDTPEPQGVPSTVRIAVLRAYGMEQVPHDQYELDYLITPELGGISDVRNLWPQRYGSRVWNAGVKDQLEQLLPRLVCDGKVSLETARQDIARDWIAAYREYFRTDTPLQAHAKAPTLTLLARLE